MRAEIRVEEVLKIRQTVLGCHLEEKLRIWMVPIKIRSDIVRGNGKGENSTFGISTGHDFDVGPVDHVHLVLKIAIGKRHFLAAD